MDFSDLLDSYNNRDPDEVVESEMVTENDQDGNIQDTQEEYTQTDQNEETQES